jgi:predicted transcriptional regulator
MKQNIQFPSYRETLEVARALDSPLRCTLLQLLAEKNMNISQLCDAMRIPQSTCTSNIKILEAAGLVESRQEQGVSHGMQKICSLKYTKTLLSVVPSAVDNTKNKVFSTEMPIGLFTDFSVTPPCGMCSEKKLIGIFDNVSTFLSPERAAAELIWFTWGRIDYRFPKDFSPDAAVKSLTFSAELCSEYPCYNTEWPSDITLSINGMEIGTWTSPGDMGGEHGRLTPDWWTDENTQYGFLTTWKVNMHGSWIGGKMVSNVTPGDLQISKYNYITVQIGVKENAVHRGGINIFGSKFGNFPQNLILETEII